MRVPIVCLQNTRCIRKPQVISGGGGGGGGRARIPCTLPLDPPMLRVAVGEEYVFRQLLGDAKSSLKANNCGLIFKSRCSTIR